MAVSIQSAALRGIDAHPIDVEVEVLAGLPSFHVVGLGDASIKESKERLTAALTNSGYNPPRRKTIVSLAPASLKKEGSLYDLPITLAFLLASKQLELSAEDWHDTWFIGELGLEGSIRSVRGALPIALAAIKTNKKQLVLPAGNAAEVAPLAAEISLIPVNSLTELIQHLAARQQQKESPIKALSATDITFNPAPADIDMAHIQGQELAKRALAICAAGAHNVLLVGPPGTGKTLLAEALAGILPPVTKEEAYTITSLYSIAGLLPNEQGIMTHRPFRAPHHGASSAALVGGGNQPKPGEVSLAHHGVLFLDELPEFSRAALEQLRQPIESGTVTIARAAQSLQFPARSMLVAAMNPCPCGFIGSTRRDCTCTPADVLRYQRRVSGPLLDRFDLHVMVADVPTEKLLDGQPDGLSSDQYRHQITAARKVQIDRQGKTNSALNPQELKEAVQLDSVSRSLIIRSQEKFHLSSRGIHRLLKVARTIADLTGQGQVTTQHLAEALQYREQLKTVLPDFA